MFGAKAANEKIEHIAIEIDENMERNNLEDGILVIWQLTHDQSRSLHHGAKLHAVQVQALMPCEWNAGVLAQSSGVCGLRCWGLRGEDRQ